MIQKNLVAKEQTIDLVDDEEMEPETAPQVYGGGSQFLQNISPTKENEE
jgi:hypothetical protein